VAKASVHTDTPTRPSDNLRATTQGEPRSTEPTGNSKPQATDSHTNHNPSKKDNSKNNSKKTGKSNTPITDFFTQAGDDKTTTREAVKDKKTGKKVRNASPNTNDSNPCNANDASNPSSSSSSSSSNIPNISSISSGSGQEQDQEKGSVEKVHAKVNEDTTLTKKPRHDTLTSGDEHMEHEPDDL
jgi:hypothetical protein